MPLTLVQKRALLAAANNVYKKELAYSRTFYAYHVHPSQRNILAVMRYDAAVANLNKAGEVLYRLAEKLGVNTNAINYRTMSRNVISNVIKKHGLGPHLEDKIWLKGLNAEKKRALANFAQFSRNPRAVTPRRRPSPARKTPSPVRRRTPSPARPANNAHRRVHGIGPANNTRITWSRNANGKINRFKTLENINMHLTQAQRNALLEMSENKAMNVIRQLARQR